MFYFSLPFADLVLISETFALRLSSAWCDFPVEMTFVGEPTAARLNIEEAGQASLHLLGQIQQTERNSAGLTASKLSGQVLNVHDSVSWTGKSSLSDPGPPSTRTCWAWCWFVPPGTREDSRFSFERRKSTFSSTFHDSPSVRHFVWSGVIITMTYTIRKWFNARAGASTCGGTFRCPNSR